MESSLLNLANLTQTLISFTNLYILAAISLILAALFFSNKPNPVYLLDFSCYRPPDFCRAPLSTYIEHAELSIDVFDAKSIEFQTKVMERSGLGNETCVPIGINQLPPDLSMSSARGEVETVLFAAVEDLFAKQDINPKNIDILISNCSLFCPTPSIPAMIINKFGFRENVRSFNLSGMGCSGGIASISLARDLLKVHKNSLALIVSMEAIAPNGYAGKVKSMLLTNCLFRMGGATILLSNRQQEKKTAKYMLQHLVRTHLGSDDRAFNCVRQEPDDEGLVGVSLSRNILQVAGDALKTNMISLGPLVLPYSELFRYGWSQIQRKIWAPAKAGGVYVPNFRKAFEHFCIHAGGKAVIEEIEKKLGFRDEDIEASKMTLHRFGNTSSSSIWYALCYLESKGRVKRGDRVCQISFGSGFKCNSAVWKCVSDMGPQVKNAWSDRIHLYPVEVPDVLDH